MNRIRIVSLALCASAAALACAVFVQAAAPAADPRIERGKYLVTIMACNDCHTPGTFYGVPDFGRFLSGSELGWVGPWGVVYAANLTSDPETGLGKWKPDEIAMAIRSGNRPDGRQLAPAMPWLNYSNLTDDDALAIAAYLKTLKPVKHAVPKPLPPGEAAKGPVLAFPPPSAWDAPRTGAPTGK
ncbi:MAG: cytochrome c [Candidatus Eisenbacteria bacterium]